jgi:hypothetical protein
MRLISRKGYTPWNEPPTLLVLLSALNRVFIQNKSHNRKLRGRTQLLYEFADADLSIPV